MNLLLLYLLLLNLFTWFLILHPHYPLSFSAVFSASILIVLVIRIVLILHAGEFILRFRNAVLQVTKIISLCQFCAVTELLCLLPHPFAQSGFQGVGPAVLPASFPPALGKLPEAYSESLGISVSQPKRVQIPLTIPNVSTAATHPVLPPL